MIHLGLTTDGKRGFPVEVAKYLAPKYGYAPDRVEQGRAQIAAACEMLAAWLGDGAYLGVDRPNAADVYVATFLTPLAGVAEADCPKFAPPLRAAFNSAHDELGSLVPPSLFALRKRMFEQHLGWPIEL
jgi:glutathione S-transferase